MNNLPAPAAPSSTTSSTTTSAVAEIIVLHGEIVRSARETVEAAIRCGELLVEQKSKLRHGQWLRWIESNLPFSQQTASNYVRLYTNRDKLPTVGNLELTDAYKLICEPPDEADSKPPTKAKSIRGATIDVETVVTPGAATGNPCAPPPLIERIVDFGQRFGMGPEPEPEEARPGVVAHPELMKPEPMLSTDREAVANSFREWLNQWRDVPGVREIVSDILRGTAA